VSDSGEQSFEPTPQRIEKAKREGNVPRAGELGANLAFAGAFAALAAASPALRAGLRAAVLHAAAGEVPWSACVHVLFAAIAVLSGGAVGGAIGCMLQNGGFMVVPVAAKLERLNPLEGLKRILSRETISHTARSALAFGAASAAMLACLNAASMEMAHAESLRVVASAAWTSAVRLCWIACGIGTLFALAEYGAARNTWLRKLRMSFEERKREAREQEGDPLARGRRRSLHRAYARGAVGSVKEASFVVVNPTHVAVALQYRPPQVAVPRVLVRAVDAGALRVRELAARYRIPVVENAVLARALYRDGRAGEAIPHAHYVALAEVVAALMRAGAIAP
jgi:flagellar biosynthesis protein FlhB